MKTYHAISSAAFNKLGDCDHQIGVEFISAFIRGIRENKTRAKLVQELQQYHPSKDKDGKLEIYCEWLDIQEALKKAELIDEKNKRA